jgi:hypothetical protein
MRADALVTGDLLGGEATRDQPQDLYLTVGEREASARTIEQNAARHRPADERAEREPRRCTDIHGGTSGRGLRRRR